MLRRHYIIFSLLFLLSVNGVFAQDALTSKEKQKEKNKAEEKAKDKEWTALSPDFAPMRFSFSGDSYLGVYLEEVTSDHMKELNLREERGAVIMKVAEGSPAEKAGLKENDVIVSFNGRRVDTVKELQRLLGETPSGRNVAFEVIRGGSTQTFTATLTKRAANTNLFQGNLEPFKLQEKEWQQMEKQLKRSEHGREKAEEARKHAQELQQQLQGSFPKDFGKFYFDNRGLSFWGGTRIGVSVESLTDQLASYFGVKDGKGVLVTEVVKDSAAEKAGLRAGDIILEVDNQKIDGTDALITALSKKSEGQVVLKILRNRDEKSLNVTIEKRELLTPKKRRAVVNSQLTGIV
jgi:serine protease Do